jgi:Zinc finger, C2H2 type
MSFDEISTASALLQTGRGILAQESMDPWLWMSNMELSGNCPTECVAQQLRDLPHLPTYLVVHGQDPLSGSSEMTSNDIPAIPPPLPFPVPYITNQCLWPGCKSLQKEFLTSHDLDFHIHTYHMQQCPWPTCSTGKAFRRRSDLLRHMESVHSGTRRYLCDFPLCKRSYARSDKLTAHKRSHFNRASRLPVPDMNTRLFGLRAKLDEHSPEEPIEKTHPSQRNPFSTTLLTSLPGNEYPFSGVELQ